MLKANFDVKAPHTAAPNYRAAAWQAVFYSGDINGSNATDAKVMLSYVERIERADAEVARLKATAPTA